MFFMLLLVSLPLLFLLLLLLLRLLLLQYVHLASPFPHAAEGGRKFIEELIVTPLSNYFVCDGLTLSSSQFVVVDASTYPPVECTLECTNP